MANQSQQSSFVVNHQKLVADTIDEEVIIVNLETGAYYSLRESAWFVWERLLSGTNLDQLAMDVRSSYTSVPETLDADLRSFIADLLADELVISVNDAAPMAQPVPLKFHEQPFTPPEIEKFTELADLLLLDPIHEVEEDEGWPFKKKPKTL